MTEREHLAQACRQLLDRGLVVRTWGNISVRLDEERMLISPSGLPYEALRPQDFVEVRITDGSWSGDRKPSSERNLHAAVYRSRPEVASVVHTHQTFASALAATRIPEFPVDGAARGILGDVVPCAAYAMPTTKALARSVAAVAGATSARAILLANHGAVCVGDGIDDAIAVAEALETFAAEQTAASVDTVGAAPPTTATQPPESTTTTERHTGLTAAAARLAARGILCDSHHLAVRTAGGFITAGDATDKPDGSLPVAELDPFFAELFAQRSDIHAALVSRSPYASLAARRGRPIPPYLDDAAQLVGLRLHVAPPPLRPAIAKHPAVLVPAVGIVSVASSLYELEAVAIVCEKLAVAAAVVDAVRSRARIPWYEALLMRLVYSRSYGKLAAEADDE